MPTALIIDDNSLNIELLEVCLHFHKIRTVSGFSGKEGFEIAKAIQPDIIFLDLLMPKETWDGYDTINHLKSCLYTQAIPVIVTTGGGDLARAIEYGCDKTMQRPFRQNHLDEILDNYLYSSNSNDPQAV